jgi:hypothetical protein
MAQRSGDTAPAVSNGRRPGTWAGDAAFAWTVVLIAFHIYLFIGGRLSVGDAPDPIPGPLSNVAGWIFNVAVLAMFVNGLVVPLALVRSWGREIYSAGAVRPRLARMRGASRER